MLSGSNNSAGIKMTAAEEAGVPAPPPRCGVEVWKTPGREMSISDVIRDLGHLQTQRRIVMTSSTDTVVWPEGLVSAQIKEP